MLTLLLLLLLILLGAGLAYLYGLLICGGPQKAAPGPAKRFRRFAIVLPAHDEELVIGASVQRLLNSDYPPDLFDVHVVADHCADNTAAVAAVSGAIAHSRSVSPRGRKGYALGWIFPQLLSDEKCYDAILVFDADSRVEPNFLQRINEVLDEGALVVQGRHVISNPDASGFSALADADMRLNNRIRNQAKTNLGLSARLMGDAMVFHRSVLEESPWAERSSLAEDREYGIHLVAKGIRVIFSSAAVSAGQATMGWRDAGPQRLRWYGGVFELQRKYIRMLLAAALRKRNAAALDLALELIFPPFSTLAIAAGLLTVVAGVLAALGSVPKLLFGLGVLELLLAAAFPLLGLIAVRAPLSAYRALVLGPVYALWRVAIGFRAVVRRGNVPWVRTRRSEEIGSR